VSGKLQGKVAVVTGAARGIGQAVARAYAAEGARVWALDVLGDEVAALDGPNLTALQMDLADADDVAATFARIEAEAGRIDVLLNNAGVIFFKPIEQTSVADWDHLQAVNLRGPFLCTRAVARGMKARRAGAILNVSSRAGQHGGDDESAYCASKFGIEGFSRALAIEFGEYNVSVNSVTPGHPVHTAMSEVTYDAETRKIWKEPEELTPAFVHLATQDAGGIHDQYVSAWDLVLQLREAEMA
jgi:NAD(P)-dependent dehydrogenase (short-subunit alcohol dehydrogenase family)